MSHVAQPEELSAVLTMDKRVNAFALFLGLLPLCYTFCTHCNTLQHDATHSNTMQVSRSLYPLPQFLAGLPHTAMHCNALQHIAIHCNTLQHTATHCNTLQHTATHCNTLQRTATHCNALQRTAIHCECVDTFALTLCLPVAPACHMIYSHSAHTCDLYCPYVRKTYTCCMYVCRSDKIYQSHPLRSSLQNTAIHCNALQHTATHRITLQHTATHCNTLQHTATRVAPGALFVCLSLVSCLPVALDLAFLRSLDCLCTHTLFLRQSLLHTLLHTHTRMCIHTQNTRIFIFDLIE